jgi:putative toxin-antitoxin system antitoxin component (TIGR02293 family)
MASQIKRNKNGNTRDVLKEYKPGSNRLPVLLDAIPSMDTGQKINLIRDGVSKNDLEVIKEQSGLDYDTLSTILAVSRATLINKKGIEKFDSATSERILLLADTLAYGQSVFEDKDRFNTWMKTSNKALGDKTPLALMDTLYGIQEIKKLIGRIEYGIF